MSFQLVKSGATDLQLGLPSTSNEVRWRDKRARVVVPARAPLCLVRSFVVVVGLERGRRSSSGVGSGAAREGTTTTPSGPLSTSLGRRRQHAASRHMTLVPSKGLAHRAGNSTIPSGWTERRSKRCRGWRWPRGCMTLSTVGAGLGLHCSFTQP
jgi:hypothetical protein